MTLGDLFAGHWTLWSLIREILPVTMVAVSAFFAGYWRGRHVESQITLDELEGRINEINNQIDSQKHQR